MLDITKIRELELFTTSNLQPDHFINLTQELSQTRQELKELKEIVDQLYYAPGAPGYVQAEADFHHQAEGLSSSPKN